MNLRTRTMLFIAGFLTLSLGIAFAAGQAETDDAELFPTKPVTIIIAANPGGGNDTATRLAADMLRPHLDQSVILENKPGAGGIVGAQYVLNQRSDGYTMYLGSYGGVGWIVDDVLEEVNTLEVGLDDFRTVFGVSTLSGALAVPVDSPFDSVADIVEYAKANPGELRWTSPGRPSSFWFGGAAFVEETGIDVVEVPGAGGAAALQMVGGGDVDFGFLATFLAEGVRDEQVKILGVWHRERDPIVPDVPTLPELGYDVITTDAVKYIMVPADVPDSRVEILAQAFLEGAKDPALGEEAVVATGQIPLLLGPEEADEYLQQNIESARQRKDQLQAILGRSAPEEQ